jgi:UDP-glucuronate 4-epimerase
MGLAVLKSTIILVTGTAGFIGFHLAKKLLERGDTVIGIDNINDYYDINLKLDRLADTGISKTCLEWYKPILSETHPNYTFIRMNIEDREELFKLFNDYKVDKVCNLAAQAGVRFSLENPFAYIDSNIVGFINILEACRNNQIKHLVYASSSSVYGNNTKMPLSTNDNVDHPISLYAATKKSNELMAHTYSHLFGIPTTGLRFFTVYGPWGRPDMALFLFTKAIKEGNPIKVFNNGNMVRDFTYVADIVEGVLRVLDNPAKISNDNKEPSRSNTAPYKVYNIGNSSPVQLMDYIKAVEVSLEKNAKKDFLPIQPGDVPVTNADVEDLIVDLGYKPNTDINFGVAQFVDWFNDYYK